MKYIKYYKIFESNDDSENSMDFLESLYLPDEKSIICPLFITEDNDKFIEVLNVKEYPCGSSVYMDNSMPYSVTFHRIKVPKSIIEIIGDVEDRDGFKYIKIPYWFYKKK